MTLRVTRLGAGTTAAELRALAPAPPDAEDAVRELLLEVREGGDAAVARLTERFDGVAVPALRVPAEEIAAASAEPAVTEALRVAMANVEQVARAQLREPVSVELPQGQRVEVTEQPVRRAAAYVPGGKAPYPSTVVMCAVTARTAGVDELAVCAPPGEDGRAHPVILAACSLCGVDEVYLMGGVQAIGALAYGTESVAPVDVIVGPGNAWVQEAKRQVSGTVGIDMVAGPSELFVVASAGAEPELLALDLLAQAEHGEASPLVVASADAALLDAVELAVNQTAPGLASVTAAPLALVHTGGLDEALALADAYAPEHLELAGEDAEALAGRVRFAGCVFVGRDGGTAFGDYVAGSNHVLPTGGAARFASGLSVSTFRRRMARVSLPDGAARRLAPHGAVLARAEGFPVHGESMERRS